MSRIRPVSKDPICDCSLIGLQVVWKATTQIGCAKVTCPADTILPAGDALDKLGDGGAPEIAEEEERGRTWCGSTNFAVSTSRSEGCRIAASRMRSARRSLSFLRPVYAATDVEYSAR